VGQAGGQGARRLRARFSLQFRPDQAPFDRVSARRKSTGRRHLGSNLRNASEHLLLIAQSCCHRHIDKMALADKRDGFQQSRVRTGAYAHRMDRQPRLIASVAS